MAPLLLLVFMLPYGCKKDVIIPTYILKEDFPSVYQLAGQDWRFLNNNSPGVTAQWVQGIAPSKVSTTGFPAHSYSTYEDEYAFVNGHYAYLPAPAQISSWMITPIITAKNGDIIRFFTRSATQAGSIDRLQVLMNETSPSSDAGNTPESVGDFTKILLDINANQTPNGFPGNWTPYTVTISGINGTIQTRLAFRFVANGLNASGVGLDEFSITRK